GQVSSSIHWKQTTAKTAPRPVVSSTSSCVNSLSREHRLLLCAGAVVAHKVFISSALRREMPCEPFFLAQRRGCTKPCSWLEVTKIGSSSSSREQVAAETITGEDLWMELVRTFDHYFYFTV
ncbi:unnamed protein product, partial [Amoebophrya sp. A120]